MSSVAMVVTNVFQVTQTYLRNQSTKCFSPLNDPSVFGVLYLSKYFGNFTNFISHAKSIYLKNIGHDCGNTIGS
jgi:hypothetical protein